MSFGPRRCAVFGAFASIAVAAVGAPATRAQSSFSDVPAGHWAAQSVQKLSERGIVSGYPGRPGGAALAPSTAKRQAYAGNKPVTRYELAVTLYRFVQYLERADGRKRGSAAAARAKSALPAAVKDGAEAVRRLVIAGYLPADTPLGQNGSTLVTANQLADVMAQVLARATEKRTPITPESKRAPIDHSHSVPGS